MKLWARSRAPISRWARARSANCAYSTTSRQYELVDTPEALERLTQHVQGCKRVAIDTEFTSFPKRVPTLQLFQLATEEVSSIVDPQAFGGPGALAPLIQAVCEAGLVVAHSPHTDFELMYKISQKIPERPFCTQVAADVLGLGDSIGLGDLISAELDVPLEKRWSNSNWAARPLPEDQLQYAIDDVNYLLPLVDSLQKQMNSRPETLDWFAQETKKRFSFEAITVNPDPMSMWQRLPLRVLRKADLEGLCCVRQLAAWRESRSVERNLAAPAVLTNDAMQQLSSVRPSCWKELELCNSLKEAARHRIGDQVLSCVQVGRAAAESEQAKDFGQEVAAFIRQKQAPRGLVAVLEAAVNALSSEHRVAGSMLLSRDQIQMIATGSKVEAVLNGWQADLVGDRVARLVSGDLAVKWDGSKPVIV